MYVGYSASLEIQKVLKSDVPIYRGETGKTGKEEKQEKKKIWKRITICPKKPQADINYC